WPGGWRARVEAHGTRGEPRSKSAASASDDRSGGRSMSDNVMYPKAGNGDPAWAESTPVAARVWDVDLRKRLAHAGRSFELDVRFASAARRLVLFGPSGAGKTQTLRMIAGLGTPDAGHVRVAGRTLFDRTAGIDVPARKRGMAYLFQDYALFPHLTVAQNIAFGVQRGWLNAAREPRHEAVDRWLRTFELTAVARQYPEQLSGGQRQRTALARALVAQPRALLL